MKPPAIPHNPNSIDFALMDMARRRQLRERLSMFFAGLIVSALVATFYQILCT